MTREELVNMTKTVISIYLALKLKKKISEHIVGDGIETATPRLLWVMWAKTSN